MKTVLFVFSMTLVLSACNMANEEDYKNMATDMCGCVNDATANLSDEGKKIIIASGENGTNLSADLLEYGQKDPVQAMQDNIVMASLGEIESMDCVKNLEKKYADVYSTDSEKEMQEKLVKVMGDIKECQLTYSLMKTALSMQ